MDFFLEQLIREHHEEEKVDRNADRLVFGPQPVRTYDDTYVVSHTRQSCPTRKWQPLVWKKTKDIAEIEEKKSQQNKNKANIFLTWVQNIPQVGQQLWSRRRWLCALQNIWYGTLTLGLCNSTSPSSISIGLWQPYSLPSMESIAWQ